jgi:glycine/D-amino acid oxidase-like deaminating enzyme
LKIAIIGAGFAGLACAWHLLELSPKISVTVFDKKGLAGGASGVSAGLLHYATGPKARPTARSLEGFAAAKALIHVAMKHDPSIIIHKTGILRIAASPEQAEHFACSAETHNSLKLCSPEETLNLDPRSLSLTSLLVTEGMAIDPKRYLNALWQELLLKGATLEKTEVERLNELKGYDHVIVAAGFDSSRFPEIEVFKLRPIKGQVLDLEWPTDPLERALIHKKYLTMTNNPQVCTLGGTFEKGRSDPEADAKEAAKLLFPEILKAYRLPSQKIIDCRAGIRTNTAGHQALAQKVKEGLWVLTALGSKGLLLHSLLAKNLSKALLFPCKD